MIFSLLLSLSLRAEPIPDPAERLNARLERLERVIEAVRPESRVTLLGPVASKIYDRTPDGLRLGLSTEFFTFRQGEATTSVDHAAAHTNVLDLRPTLGYRLHPRLLFNAQLSFDTGGAERSDTVTLRKGGAVVRFAYLDWAFSPRFEGGLRVGHQLVPVGLSNTGADALTFFGVRRPPLEREILPNDWHENGALAWFDARQVILEAGVFSSLDARGFRGPTFVGGGRSAGQRSPTADAMAIARVNVNEAGWLIGGSFALGGSAQGNPALPAGRVQLGELHARRRGRRMEFGAQVVEGRLTDAGPISALNNTVMGSRATGVAGEAAYEILGDGGPKLWLFARQSAYDLNARVPEGYAADPTLNRTETTLGANYLPLVNLVVKADVTRADDAADNQTTEVSVGLGLIY